MCQVFFLGGKCTSSIHFGFEKKEMNTCIQQGRIKLNKSNSQGIYDVTKELCLKKKSSFEWFPQKY